MDADIRQFPDQLRIGDPLARYFRFQEPLDAILPFLFLHWHSVAPMM